jgi:hypothetical protein
MHTLMTLVAAPDGVTIDPGKAVGNGRFLLLGFATLVMILIGIKVMLKNHQTGNTSQSMSSAMVVFIGLGIIAMASVPLITGIGGGVLTAIVTFLGGHIS